MILRRFLSCAATISFLAFALSTHAEVKKAPYYVSFDVGASYPVSRLNQELYQHKPSQAELIEISAGKCLNKHLRTEISLSYRHHYKYQYLNQSAEASASQTFNNHAAIFNLYYNLDEYRLLTPYFFIGAGVSRNKSSCFSLIAPSLGVESNNGVHYTFAWNIGLGSAIKVFDDVYVSMGYKYIELGMLSKARYVYTSNGLTVLKLDNAFPGSLKVHEIELGLIYKL